MNRTSIEWCDFTWNPIHARLKSNGKQGNFCTRISPGCKLCYASIINRRFGNGLEYEVPNLELIEFYLDEHELQSPLRKKTPAKIFVGDMFDLFHEAIPEEFIGHVFAVMAQCPQHIFQVLTKRTDEMLDCVGHADAAYGPFDIWPLPNVWLGTSVESQKYADQRIPLLLETPAAVRFLSVEPLLEQINIQKLLSGIDLAIIGGESGPGARTFNLSWADSLHVQCKDADVAFFLKQVGSNPRTAKGIPFHTKDSKGGNPEEWPERLRVRQWPKSKVTA